LLVRTASFFISNLQVEYSAKPIPHMLCVEVIAMRITKNMCVIEHRETYQRYLFDMLRHSVVPYLNEYKLVTKGIPLAEKYQSLPIFDAYF
jgi:hypothetical protein